jgi:hypothetical protein
MANKNSKIRRPRSVRMARRQKRLYIHYKKWTSKRTGRRAKLAKIVKQGAREVVNETSFAYELFFFKNTSDEYFSFSNGLAKLAKNNFAGEYKIHRYTHHNKKRYASSMKLTEDSDLMIFMLLHKEKVRKVFRYTKEPA